MAYNLFSGKNIIVAQIEGALQEEKRKGNIRIEYFKIKSFAGALKEASGGKKQIAKYELDDLLEKARRECNISSKDMIDIEKVFSGETSSE